MSEDAGLLCESSVATCSFIFGLKRRELRLKFLDFACLRSSRCWFYLIVEDFGKIALIGCRYWWRRLSGCLWASLMLSIDGRNIHSWETWLKKQVWFGRLEIEKTSGFVKSLVRYPVTTIEESRRKSWWKVKSIWPEMSDLSLRKFKIVEEAADYFLRSTSILSA